MPSASTTQAEYVGTEEAAAQLKLTAQRVRILCAQGRIHGAIRIGERSWAIPLPITRTVGRLGKHSLT